MDIFYEDKLAIAQMATFLDGKTILITGATGLIGSIMVYGLIQYNQTFAKKPIKIVVQTRSYEKAYQMFNNSVSYAVNDITENIEYNDKVDYIVHLAAETKSERLLNNPTEVIKTSILGSINVFEFAKRNNAKIVYCSSMEAFGSVSLNERATEEDLGNIDLSNVRNAYPESKRMCEVMARSYYKQFGLRVVSARLAQTFGAGVAKTENRVFMQFANSVINNTDIILHTKGDSVGNYCYTTDAIIGIFILLQKGVDGETYNIVNESSTMTIYEMATLCAEKVGKILKKNIKVVFDIPNDNKYGYASKTNLKLSGQKLYNLGFKPRIDLEQSYLRLIYDIQERL